MPTQPRPCAMARLDAVRLDGWNGRPQWRQPRRQARTRDWGALGELLLWKAGEAARCAQHAAGNLDNRHVEILCAASARVNDSVLYQFVDTAKRPWPTSVAPRAGFSRSGSAWLGRFQKDGLPSCRGSVFSGSRPLTRAQGGAACRCPFLIGSGNGRQDARPYFARRPLALLRRLRLELGSPCFGFGLFRFRRCRRLRHSREALALTWAS